MEVIEAGDHAGGVAPDAAVFLDDAHFAAPSVLDQLRPLVTAPRSRLFIALRPWPRTRELNALIEAIRQRGHEMRLEHLRRDAVDRWAAAALEGPPTPAILDLLYAETGGLPVLVDEVLEAWRHDLALLGGPVPVVPAAVVERLQQIVEGTDAAVRAVLQAVAVGSELEPESAAAVVGMDRTDAAEAIAAARTSGFLLPDGRLVPLAAAAILRSAPPELARAMRARLLRLRHQQHRDTVPLARELARAGVHDGFVADLLTSAGDELRPRDPAGALELYADAVDAGAAVSSLGLRRAESAARSGRFDLALRLVDAVLADPDGPDFAAGVEIAATVMAHQGQLERAGELYEWLSRSGHDASTPMGLIALMATGRALAASPVPMGTPEPTLAGGGRALMARGVWESIHGEPAAALSTVDESDRAAGGG